MKVLGLENALDKILFLWKLKINIYYLNMILKWYSIKLNHG